MKVYIEKLYHLNCNVCGAWWTMADAQLKEEDTVYCPKCATLHKIQEFEIGEDKLSINQKVLDEDFTQLELPLSSF